MTTIRKITISLVLAAFLLSFFVNVGTGTLSSMGWEAIAYICPLGAVETFLASWTFVPRALIGLILVALAVILLGKVFCAWLCPVPPLRKFFTLKKDDSVGKALKASHDAVEASAAQTALIGLGETDTSLTTADTETVVATQSQTIKQEDAITLPESSSQKQALHSLPEDIDMEKGNLSVLQENDTENNSSSCSSGCSGCATKRKKLDSRHVVLGGALLSTAILGFPVFCIICPVGLTFASLIALWRLVGFNEPSWALLIFPLFLAIELFVLRKWCLKFCPLGAVMSLLSIPNRLFRPIVDNKKCLRTQGIDCAVCVTACEEELDPHFKEGMHECTKCGLCKEKCPVGAISFSFLPKKGAYSELKPQEESLQAEG